MNPATKDEALSTSYRTSAAGALRGGDAGAKVLLVGWVHRRRDLGGLVFIDLRDRLGLVQVSFDPAWSPADILAEARAAGPEDVVQVEGVVERRPEGMRNPALPTGEIEVRATAMRVITRAEPLPIPVYRTPEEELPAEDLRLRYRYLDLRRPELQHNLQIRHLAAQSARRYLSEQAFLEIETPMLTRRTPEGARDYLVPSRTHPGEFYALPQSPQLYKQLLMVSGYDRYFQIARCLRDEDLRADRQPEFTQIDAEMSFVDEEDVFRLGEGLMAAIFREVAGVELELPFPRLPYAQAMARYGTDKPDLRFEMPIEDLTELLQQADFRVFQATEGTGQRIRGLRVPGGGALSRRELDELQEVARRGGAPGALWVKRGDQGFSGQFARALEGGIGERFQAATGMEAGDLFVAVVGEFRSGAPRVAVEAEGPAAERSVPTGLEAALDELRRHLARKLNLVDQTKHAWAWITDFPLFDWDPDAERLVAAHHPFTMPHPEDLPALLAATGSDEPIGAEAARRLFLGGMRSQAYDAVYNGNELASGSVRIHDPELQRRVFRTLGIGPEQAKSQFGFLLEAFRYGAPPHAGFAFGFDRLVMLLAGASSLREVVAFPKTTSARALFEGAPSAISEAELRELHLRSAER
ncbi:MAG TPA: aspartate--tRNA ligase [Longimicrobiaceae bacterium]|nr:aspartate--tRNA ligase [Longimicrobiaceae bacterium]